MTVKTRFAPSPTGVLHIGGARTALFSWLFARHHGGEFALRIEDTDRERSTDESVQAILDGMAWLGLDHDGEVVFQTQRFDRYRELIQKLLDEDKAYYCTCSKERLEKLREAQMAAGEKPRYDGKCRDANVPAGTPGAVVRFKNPTEGAVTFQDHVRGEITVQNEELDDLIIARADGTPTYNFTVVVDDMDMGMTHVIRGDDHINNTPRQINLYRALGATPPEFAHVPMILGDDGARLSKRHGAVGVMQYAEDGYLPEAVLNYLVRLGWSHGDQEIFSREEMIKLFDLSGINRAPSTFNTSKLNWLNQHYMQQADNARLAELLAQRLHKMGLDVPPQLPLEDVVSLFKERSVTINDMAEQARFLFEPVTGYDEKADKKIFKAAALEPLRTLYQRLEEIPNWESADLHAVIEQVVNDLGVGFGKVGQPLRLALTGQSAGPANDAILRLLGQAESLRRIQQAIQHIQQKLADSA
jgi:glutamyl-tRNA synthetase